MEIEIAIYEKAIAEAIKLLETDHHTEAREVLWHAKDDTDKIRQMRSIAQEEIKKTFGDC